MPKLNLLYSFFLVIAFCSISIAQDFVRKQLDVPKADSGAIKIDGVMDESAWDNAAQVNLITDEGYEIFINKYGREGLAEPEFDELYGRLLWSKDTLYAFIHVNEFVNDSTDLFWLTDRDTWWGGDQLFVSLSNRLGINMSGNYQGDVYNSPDGPYHFLVLGDSVTLFGDDSVAVPEEARKCFDQSDSVRAFFASDIVNYAITINQSEGVWDIEMAIYHPDVEAHSSIGFNLGGSTGSSTAYAQDGDAYGYYTWQPNNSVSTGDPFADPYGNGDPGFYNLANSDYWAVLHFLPGPGDVDRKMVDVPKADSGAIKIDGVMDEAAWDNAAQVNLITDEGYEIFINKYGREGLAEPEFDELYGRLLWSKDTLYAFIHVNEFVNDSTDLFWLTDRDSWWGGDQLFVSLSNRLGINMSGNYQGDVYNAPDGPYHFLVLGDSVTLFGDDVVGIPFENRRCEEDSQKTFFGYNVANYAVNINLSEGIWDIEMAIYHPDVEAQSSIGFNIGGSTGSSTAYAQDGDAYGYYTWQPNNSVGTGDPFADPYGNGDPGFYNLANSDYWAILNFVTGPTGVKPEKSPVGSPAVFNLSQNFPNPFNPSTTIKFQIPNQSLVSLKIFNIVGEEVATLINGVVLNGGAYSADFDASRLASGVYFYELRAGGFVQSKKMVLLK